VKDGKPYVMFGDGQLASCKPISEEDLASFIVDCVQQQDKVRQGATRGARGGGGSGQWPGGGGPPAPGRLSGGGGRGGQHGELQPT
jgi:hypothetical protein